MKKFLLTIFLFQVFQVMAQPEKTFLCSWKFRHFPDTTWYTAVVPGTVHTDIMRTGIIPDPFYGDNEKSVQWIENEDWVYRCDFHLTPSQSHSKSITLVFKGLDTYASISLNERLLAETDNMFRSWSFDIKKYLLPGNNRLEIIFHSAVKKGKELASKLSYTLPGDEKVFTRKAQYQYGWDWGPRLVTCGIWKPVYLEFGSGPKIKDVHILQKKITIDTAVVAFLCQTQSLKKGTATLSVTNAKDPQLNIEQPISLKKGSQEFMVEMTVPSPLLWWPNGLGRPNLYDFVIEIRQGKDILSAYPVSIGLRTVELIREKDGRGESFLFKINGIPVFIKGANYIPPDNFLSRVDSATYQSLIGDARTSNLNMLRVWGGGAYEQDLFYDLCDKNGILVWQDFMFACAMYPGDRDFLENVSEEARENVIRLRNHPCLALWCGNNEIDEGWNNWGWQKQFGYSPSDSSKIWKDYLRLFHEVLPSIVNECDPGKPYWPSSPSIGWGRKESLQSGDSHYWGVWWGMEPFGVYEQKVGRFMSEYGFQGFPDMKTIDRFGDKEDNYLDSDVMKAHQKHPKGYETIQTYMEREYQAPRNLPEYSFVSQCLQADGIRRAIEAHRRAKPSCMGTLYWQFNDCWPVVSWSGRDWFGRWKALQYAVKRAYEPVLVSIYQEESEDISIYLINDTDRPIQGQMEVKMFVFNGNMLFMKAFRNITVDNLENTIITLKKEDYHKQLETFGIANCVLQVVFWDDQGRRHQNLHYFAPPKQLKITHNISIDVRKIKDGTFTISLIAHTLTKNLNLVVTNEDAWFSDNDFDMLPGEKKEIQCTCNISVEKMLRSLKSTSLGNIYY